MKSLVLTQPMFLPWPGLFEQAMLADVLVFHDNIQLPRSHGRKKSFQTRVQIKTFHGWRWLSLPVRRSGASGSLICQAEFAASPWRDEHLRQIERAYHRAPFFEQIWADVVRPIYERPTERVADFCEFGMTRILKMLKCDVPIYRSSQLDIPAALAGSRRVLAHCLHFGVTDYITGLGARNYIDYDLFEDHGIRIHYMDYARTPYRQLYGAFDPYVSIIDLLFNTGPRARDYLRSTTRYWKTMSVETAVRAIK